MLNRRGCIVAHWKTVLLLVAATASTSLGCCYVRPMHGLILRGDWSLEVNRVPWINQRTVNSNDAAYTCGPAVVSESTVSPTPAQGETTATVAPTAYHTRRCLRCAGSRVQPAVAAEPAGVAAAAEPAKFHPVPTAPVFHPEQSSSGGKNDSSADSAPASSSPQTAPPSAPEIIPTPAPMPPSQSSGWKARGNVSTAAAKKPASWVFRAVPVDPTAPTPALARSGASMRR
ncbi:MAG: hypothetical protein D6741_13205 [Planctomycetota bacterium]|nr:MAG: hypothetical protein D6741_13205 [Planctomycetota bacterium]